jgi:hypothetical protein
MLASYSYVVGSPAEILSKCYSNCIKIYVKIDTILRFNSFLYYFEVQ